MRLLATLAGLSVMVANAIYPVDHFEYSTKLTNENHEKFISDNISAGKTVFLRTIASSG